MLTLLKPVCTNVHNLIKTSTQNKEMAVASCNKRAGTRLGTTEAAAGAERQTQDVTIVAAVILKVLWLPLHHL